MNEQPIIFRSITRSELLHLPLPWHIEDIDKAREVGVKLESRLGVEEWVSL